MGKPYNGAADVYGEIEVIQDVFIFAAACVH